MHPFVDQCKKYIDNKNLFGDKSKLIVAVSGGCDSITLAHVLLTLNYDIALAHCNFKLRGKDSDEDEQFVKKFALNSNKKLYIKTFDTEVYAKENKISIEESARILRYGWFEELRKEIQYDFIVTGHQRNDLIETFFINLTAGTGIKGLKSIPPKNNCIVRPLLFADSNTIKDYCLEHEINYRTDHSNFDTKIIRNKIRHQIIPLFQQINPGFIETMSRNIEIYNEFHQIYNRFLETKLKDITYTSAGLVYIDFERILTAEAPITLLYELISPYGFNSTQTKEIISKPYTLQTGKTWYSHYYRVIKHRKHLIIGQKKNEIHPFELGEDQIGKGPLRGFKMTYIDPGIPIDFSDQNTAYIDAEKLQFPLIVRQVEKSDYFYPFGMKGKKLISNFFTDLKLHTYDREKTLVITSGNRIVWVIGQRIDDHYKIEGSTRKILQIIQY